jgi:predicted O-methyltransferase YrrM
MMNKVRQLLQSGDIYADFEADVNSDMQGWGSDHQWFGQLIKILAPSLIVEVGSWKGRSAVHMGNKCKEFGLATEIVCVDTWLGSPGLYTREGDQFRGGLKMRHGYPTLYYTFLSNVKNNGLEELVTPFPLPSLLAAEVLSHFHIKAQLIYVDGAHDFKSVSDDLNAFWPLVSEDGVIMGDDYSWPTVARAANEFSVRVQRPLVISGEKYAIEKGAGEILSKL